MANLTKAEAKLFLYESTKNGVLEEEEMRELLEMVDDAETLEDVEAIVEAVSNFDSEEEPTSNLEDVLEAVTSYLEDAKEEYENDVEEDPVLEAVNETKLNVYEACKQGHISKEEQDQLLEIVESVLE